MHRLFLVQVVKWSTIEVNFSLYNLYFEFNFFLLIIKDFIYRTAQEKKKKIESGQPP